jgi:hypothetical protein
MNGWKKEGTRGELKLKCCQAGEEEEARKECPIFVLFLFLSVFGKKKKQRLAVWMLS